MKGGKVKKQIHIIAEAGTNHNGKIETAMKLIDTAILAKANSVKFQLIHPEKLYLPKIFNKGQYTVNEVFRQREKWMLPDEAYYELVAYSKEKNISFSASVFDRKAVEILDKLDVDYIKIASCDLNNSFLIKLAANTGKTVIISTGMAQLTEIEKAVQAFLSTGNENLVLMHCISVYPCNLSQTNLGFIDLLKNYFGFPVGFSDHTMNNLASAIAVAKGVDYIEKHFTLNRQTEGFDHVYSMEPDQMINYVADMRSCEAACRSQFPKTQKNEIEVRNRARRGLYAAHDLESGKKLNEEDILTVRPEGKLQPNEIELVVGKKTIRKISQYEPISHEMVTQR